MDMTPLVNDPDIDPADFIQGFVQRFVRDIDERLRDYFASGTQIAWIINPDTECVEVCHAPDKRKLLGPGADLDGEHLLPGFRHPIADLFKGWDWE